MSVTSTLVPECELGHLIGRKLDAKNPASCMVAPLPALPSPPALDTNLLSSGNFPLDSHLIHPDTYSGRQAVFNPLNLSAMAVDTMPA